MMVTWVNIIWFYRRSYLLDVSWRILRYFSYDAYGAKISEFITQLVIYPLIKSIVIASPQKRWPGKSTSQAMSDDVMIFPFLPCVEKRAHTAHTFFFRSSFLSVWKAGAFELTSSSLWKMAPTKKQLSIMGTQTSSSDISQVPRFHGLTSFCQLITPMAVWGGIPFLQTSPPHSWRTCPNIPIISLSYLHIISVRNHILNYKCQVW